MTRANGSFDFFNSEWVVGIAFSVDRTYLGGQFESGEEVTLDYQELAKNTDPRLQMLTFGGRMMGGGGRSNSATLNGELRRSMGYN